MTEEIIIMTVKVDFNLPVEAVAVVYDDYHLNIIITIIIILHL